MSRKTYRTDRTSRLLPPRKTPKKERNDARLDTRVTILKRLVGAMGLTMADLYRAQRRGENEEGDAADGTLLPEIPEYPYFGIRLPVPDPG